MPTFPGGASEPKASTIGQIAVETGISLNWLVLADGAKNEGVAGPAKADTPGNTNGNVAGGPPLPPDVDAILMERMSHLVEKTYRDATQKIPAGRLVFETATFYNQLHQRILDITDEHEIAATLPQLQYLLGKRIAEAAPRLRQTLGFRVIEGTIIHPSAS